MTDPKHGGPPHPGPGQSKPKGPDPVPADHDDDHADDPADEDHDDHSRKQRQAEASNIAAALAQLDSDIIAQTKSGGPKGSGIYTLLSELACQMLGIKRAAFQSEQPAQASVPQTPGQTRGSQPPPGIGGPSPPGPLPGQGRGQSHTARASAPNTPGTS